MHFGKCCFIRIPVVSCQLILCILIASRYLSSLNDISLPLYLYLVLVEVYVVIFLSWGASPRCLMPFNVS